MKKLVGWLIVLLVGIFLGLTAGWFVSRWQAPDYSYYTTAFEYSEPAPDAETIRLDSQVLGEERVINVSLPASYGANEDQAYPVLYMPDGGLGEDFPHMVYSVRQLEGTNELPEMIIVGIENTLRQRDLTGPTNVAEDLEIAELVGQSENFRKFIAGELKPEIEKRYRCNQQDAVIGESLAGLFVVETALQDSDLFDHYMAISPSLWWNDDGLVKEAGQLLQTIDTPHRLFLCSANETDIYPQTGKLAEVFSERPSKFQWVYEPRMDLTHQTIFRAMKKKALTWTLRPWLENGAANPALPNASP